MNFPIKIKSVELSGGACPYQIEATTEDGKFFYLRYRNGRLRFGVWDRPGLFNFDYLFSEIIGDEYDGHADHNTFSEVLKGKVDFPEGFVHSYDGVDNTHNTCEDQL